MSDQICKSSAPGHPFFSVIIPTYNRERELDRALASLAAQTFRDFEVLVCDDGSTDGTGGICSKWSASLDIFHLYDRNSGGPARPRNNGVAHARGSWVCFLDSDDWWYPLKLERVREECRDADLVFHDCHAVDASGRVRNRVRGRSMSPPVFEDLMLGWNPLVTSATCVRKSVLELAGPFDEARALVAVEDFDLWLRVARVTGRFRYLAEVLGVYALGGGNISQFSEASLAREEAVFQRHVEFLPPARRRPARKMMLYRHGLIYWHLGEGSKSREMFLKALFPAHWRHRLLIFPWIAATFFAGKK